MCLISVRFKILKQQTSEFFSQADVTLDIFFNHLNKITKAGVNKSLAISLMALLITNLFFNLSELPRDFLIYNFLIILLTRFIMSVNKMYYKIFLMSESWKIVDEIPWVTSYLLTFFSAIGGIASKVSYRPRINYGDTKIIFNASWQDEMG